MSTDETARSLVDQLAAAGGWPDPRLLAAILARGSEAVEPLLAFLRSDHGDEDSLDPIIFAVHLLSSLGDASAVPGLFDLLLRRDDLEVVEGVREALREFDTEKIGPALEIARDRSLGDYARDTAVHIALDAAGDDPAALAGVAEALREILAELIDIGEERARRDDFPSYLVSALADIADPLARDLIASAFEARIVNHRIVDPESIEQSYREGARRRFVDRPESWLTEYEEHYEQHVEWHRQEPERQRQAEERRQAALLERASLDGPRAPEQSRPIPPPVETIRNQVPRPGRNDPCWCGSGKKYKKCHLPQDQA